MVLLPETKPRTSKPIFSSKNTCAIGSKLVASKTLRYAGDLFRSSMARSKRSSAQATGRHLRALGIVLWIAALGVRYGYRYRQKEHDRTSHISEHALRLGHVM